MHTNDCRIADFWIGQKELLEVCRGYLEALVFDELFQTVHNASNEKPISFRLSSSYCVRVLNMTVRIDMGDVAGSVPAIWRKAGFRRFFVPPIAPTRKHESLDISLAYPPILTHFMTVAPWMQSSPGSPIFAGWNSSSTTLA